MECSTVGGYPDRSHLDVLAFLNEMLSSFCSFVHGSSLTEKEDLAILLALILV